MKNKIQPKNQQRRAFIKKTTIAGAAVAATTMASTSAIAQVSSETTEKPVQKGYQLTSHVLDYYKSAGI